MKYTLQQNINPATIKSDCVVVPVFNDKDKAVMDEAAIQLDTACNGQIKAFLDKGDFSGKLEQTQMLYDLDSITSPRVLLVGCGDKTQYDLEHLEQATRNASNLMKGLSIKKCCLFLADSFEQDAIENALMQTVLAHASVQYQLNEYKSDKPPASKLKEVCIGLTGHYEGDLKLAVSQAHAISKGSNLARDLANQPGNICNPAYLAKQSKTLAKTYDSISVKVLDEKEMQKLGMGAFLSVSQGSEHPGKLIVLQYKGADKKQAPVALVGKGITFDTGGISLKPGANMDEMKFDMSGAAGMLGTLQACAEMKLPINLVVVLAAAENMPSGRASRPGDIVTSMAGKTIEILNTDAEGRLVLCDALTYVGKYKPEIVIDAATLTGACIVALGHQICAVLSNDDELAKQIMDAGDAINDRAWQLPMGEQYTKQLKSSFADLGNIGGRAAGTITAACFLGEFCKEYKWAHLDIAGTAWTEKDATGRPVPLLSRFLIEHCKA